MPLPDTNKKQNSVRVSSILAGVGAVPLIGGAGVFLTGGLSGVFGLAAAGMATGGIGALLIVVGSLLAGFSAGLLSYRAFENGYLGRQNIVTSLLFAVFGMPLLATTGFVLGAAGSGALSQHVFNTPAQSAPSAPLKTVSQSPSPR